MYLDAEEISKLVDGEYYWIAYQYPKADDETWDIGRYNKKFQQFSLCNRTVITPKYVIEVQKVEPPH